jgi:hypothetical protein
MTEKYRLVHFLPDPFSGARVPIAALVSGASGLKIARASHLPGAACLGSPEKEFALGYVLESLERARTLDDLPVEVGPQAILGPITSVPSGVTNPTAWVQEFVLPHIATRQTSTAPRSTKRHTRGFRFFEEWKVAQWVGKHFHPEKEWADLFSARSVGLEPVSHWAGSGQDQLLLMEPILPGRVQRDADVKAVFNRLAGYQVFLASGPEEIRKRTDVCIYVLPGAEEHRGAVISAFDTLKARVVDTENTPQRDALLDEIRTLGASRTPQAPLSSVPIN